MLATLGADRILISFLRRSLISTSVAVETEITESIAMLMVNPMNRLPETKEDTIICFRYFLDIVLALFFSKNLALDFFQSFKNLFGL
jgi:hypothetical protein